MNVNLPLSLSRTLPLRRQVMLEDGKLDTRQARVAVSPWATSADLTPGIWGETSIKTKQKRKMFSLTQSCLL